MTKHVEGGVFEVLDYEGATASENAEWILECAREEEVSYKCEALPETEFTIHEIKGSTFTIESIDTLDTLTAVKAHYEARGMDGKHIYLNEYSKVDNVKNILRCALELFQLGNSIHYDI